MTTEKQINANRINALKAGIKTEEGKVAVRLNAVTHGIFSKEVLLPGEDGELLAALRESYMAELQPVGELETMLVEDIITDTWRMKRLVRSEKKYARIPASDPKNTADFIAGGDYRYSSWQNFIKYEAALKRGIIKSLHELERLQNARLSGKTTRTFSDFFEESAPKNNFSKTNPI